MAQPEQIHVATEENPILTRYEPGFRRFFAKGSLVSHDQDDPQVLHLAFWSSRDENLELDEGKEATGYALESEVVLTWRAAERLHGLLGMWLERHKPPQGTALSAAPPAKKAEPKKTV